MKHPKNVWQVEILHFASAPFRMTNYTYLPIKLEHLPNSLPLDGAVRIELVEGVPIFRASTTVIEQIEILRRSYESSLATDEENELDGYEELDDYLSLVNRIIRCSVAKSKSRIK